MFIGWLILFWASQPLLSEKNDVNENRMEKISISKIPNDLCTITKYLPNNGVKASLDVSQAIFAWCVNSLHFSLSFSLPNRTLFPIYLLLLESCYF